MKNSILLSMLSAGIISAFTPPANGHDHKKGQAEAQGEAKRHENILTLDQFSALAGWNFETAQITSQKLQDGFHVLFGLGGNIAVSIGPDGTLIVDDQFPQLIPKIDGELKTLGSHKIDYVINTHWHFDHAEGNLTLGKEGTRIISHNNSRAMMSKNNLINFGPLAYEQQAYPDHALSDITFGKDMSLYFNDERIDLVHFGAAHTNGDAAVIFRGKNAVHMGDVFNNSGYPFIDADNGGDLNGMIAFCQAVHDIIDEKTVIIPGHGAIADRAKLARYIEILQTIEVRVQKLIDEGNDLDAILTAKPTADFDLEMHGNEFAISSFLSRVYASLTRE